MRLRLAVGVIVVLSFLLGISFVIQQRARAEHIRVALFQAQAAAEAETKVSESAPAKVASAEPSTAPSGSLGVAAETTPVVVESVVAGPAAQPPAAPGAGLGGIVAAPLGLPRGPGGPTIQVTTPNPYGPGMMAPMAVPPWPVEDPEMSELASQDQQLEQEVQSLVRQLADSGNEKTTADLRDKLAATLEKQFDAQQKLRQLEISRIETRVKKLQDLVQKRTESRRKIIDNRLEQLLNDAEGLGWGNATRGSVQGSWQAFPTLVSPRPGTRPAGPAPATTVSPGRR